MEMKETNVSISLDEYKKLIRKEQRFDMLKGIAEKSGYLTDKERILYGIKEPVKAVE